MHISESPTKIRAIISILDLPSDTTYHNDLMPYRLSALINKGDGFEWLQEPKMRNLIGKFLIDEGVLDTWTYLECYNEQV